MTGKRDAPEDATPAIASLAERWPRALIEQGVAEDLARRWEASRQAAVRAGLPPHARHPLSAGLVALLVEARRARRLVRGLEAAELSIAAQAMGVRPSSAARADRSGAGRRISRLMLASEDGSRRFFRNIESLIRKSDATLEVLVLTCDESTLGAAVFGSGERARALLLDHKEAVVRILLGLREFEVGAEGAT